MSDRLQSLLSLFVAPSARRPDPAPPMIEVVRRTGGPTASRRPVGRRRPRPARSGRQDGASVTAVIGDAGSAAFAVDLAVAAASRAGVRCAVVAVWGALPPAPPHGHPTRAAEGLVADLQRAALEPVAGGRGVVVALDEEPGAAAVGLRRIRALAGETAVVVLAICGPRPAAFDPLLADGELLVLAIAGGAPTGLDTLAAEALTRIAPSARVVTVTLAAGGSLPRPLRHRAAIRQVLGVAR